MANTHRSYKPYNPPASQYKNRMARGGYCGLMLAKKKAMKTGKDKEELTCDVCYGQLDRGGLDMLH